MNAEPVFVLFLPTEGIFVRLAGMTNISVGQGERVPKCTRRLLADAALTRIWKMMQSKLANLKQPQHL